MEQEAEQEVEQEVGDSGWESEVRDRRADSLTSNQGTTGTAWLSHVTPTNHWSCSANHSLGELSLLSHSNRLVLGAEHEES